LSVGNGKAFSAAVQHSTLAHKEERPETPKFFACRIPVQNQERKMIWDMQGSAQMARPWTLNKLR
jgi:hypothetical protein